MTAPTITDRITRAIEHLDAQTVCDIVCDRQHLSAPLWAFIGMELQRWESPYEMQRIITKAFTDAVWTWGNECLTQSIPAPDPLKLLIEHNLLTMLTDPNPNHDNWVSICDHALGHWTAEEIFTPLSFSWALDNNRTMFEQFLYVPRLAQTCHLKNDHMARAIVQEQSLSMARAVLQWAVDTQSYAIGHSWVCALCRNVLNNAWGPLSHDLTHPSDIFDLVEDIERGSGKKFDWEAGVQEVTPYEASSIITSPKIAQALSNPEVLYQTLDRWFNTDYMESISYQSLQANNPEYAPSAKVIDQLWLKLPAADRLSVLMKLLGKKVNGNVHYWEAHDIDWNEDSLKYVDHLCSLLSVDDLRHSWIVLQATHPATAVNLWRERPLIKNLLLHDRLHEELSATPAASRSRKI